MKLMRWLLLLAPALFAVSHPVQACTIHEITTLVGRGSGISIVEQKCKIVDNGPRCTVRKVAALAFDEKDDEEILNRCGLCVDSTCEADSSWGTFPTCRPPPDFKLTDGCMCQSWVTNPPRLIPPGGIKCHN